MKKQTRKIRFQVHEDKVKTVHTSHWDWDYLPREQVDRLVRRNTSGGNERKAR